MILTDPKVVILDEATSSVDTETEELILTGLLKHYADTTMILISNRTSTLKHADAIAVLSGLAILGAAFLLSWSMELAEHDIRVNAVAPGATRTIPDSIACWVPTPVPPASQPT